MSKLSMYSIYRIYRYVDLCPICRYKSYIIIINKAFILDNLIKYYLFTYIKPSKTLIIPLLTFYKAFYDNKPFISVFKAFYANNPFTSVF